LDDGKLLSRGNIIFQDYISPIDAIAIDEKFGLQNDMSLKLLRGNSQSLLKSDYWGKKKLLIQKKYY